MIVNARAAETDVTAWRVVIPPTWELDSFGMLHEIPLDGDCDEDALGILLWRELRHLRAWIDADGLRRPPRRDRDRSSHLQEIRLAAKELAPDLTQALDLLADKADAEGLVAACCEVSQWAERKLWHATAMQYAETAAALDPDNPQLANLAGRVCRRGGQRARAEIWYDRAIGLARSQRNASSLLPGNERRSRARFLVREYVSAHLGFAAVLRDRGHYHKSLHFIKRAGLTATRAGMRGKAAEAFHDATFLATLQGELGRAEQYARRALSVYPRHHSRLPAFGHDLAFLMVERGMYTAAVSLLNLVQAQIGSPGEQLVVHGTLARAAAGVGLRSRYAEVAQEVEARASLYPIATAGALYNLAEGARLFEDWESADRLGRLAAAAGQLHDQPLALKRAERLLKEVATRQFGIPPLAGDDARGAVLRSLAPAAGLLLSRWRGSTWRPGRDV